jgi:hypothetical protein
MEIFFKLKGALLFSEKSPKEPWSRASGEHTVDLYNTLCGIWVQFSRLSDFGWFVLRFGKQNTGRPPK